MIGLCARPPGLAWGRGVGLSALVVFLSPVFRGRVLGPIGMFISVPLAMMIKIALDSRPGTH